MGLVGISVSIPLPQPTACHCTACRKQTGHYEASIDTPHTALSVSGEEHVRWYQSSEKVRRGFCDTCGSTLSGTPYTKIGLPLQWASSTGPPKPSSPCTSSSLKKAITTQLKMGCRKTRIRFHISQCMLKEIISGGAAFCSLRARSGSSWRLHKGRQWAGSSV